MSDAVDLAEAQPSFLRRIQPKEAAMTQTPPQAEKAARKKRADCYVINLRVAIPLDMENSETLIAAIKAGQDAKAPSSWPEGSTVEFTGRVGKV